ncbi:uncharacterized protein LOC120627874 [Pararge aegeria]|uniref:Jg11148 protein n=1 Tax=Pararge aegeria aegeria TaxID=348720 RepID=A0A8S4RKF7_9NEOP|nr:uncharacterized protein LOC120627874 [Pararge aegeria]CAH2237175.1 jg11148 [Pararge aegeria aegeria]
MDCRTLVYFVLLHCSINALPYERDSHESGKFTVHFGDDDKHLALDDQAQHNTFELDKHIEDEDKEIFLNEEQNQESSLETNIENEDTETLLDDQEKVKTIDFERNTKDEDEEIHFDFDHAKDTEKIVSDQQQKQKSLDFEKNTEDEDNDTFLDKQFKKEALEYEKKVVTDKAKPANYAVTELVIDVPDDRTKGPIIANYSISKPINIASTTVSTAGFDKDKNSNEGNQNTASSGSDGNKVVDPDENEDSTGIKEYFNGIKQGIVNGFNSIIHKNSNTEESHTHDGETEPFSFFNKIQRKGSDFAQKIHNHIFGDHKQDHF